MNGELHLIASIAGRTVAFKSGVVDSVVDLEQVVPVPRAAPGVAGIAALRSQVVTVIDPQVQFGMITGGEQPRRAVVTKVEGHSYAILVDALHDVAPYYPAPIPAGMALEGGWAAASHAMIEHGGAPVIVLCTGALVSHAG